MATVDKTQGTGSIPMDAPGKMYVLENDITLTAAQTVDANVIQALAVRANTKVLGTIVKIVTQSVVGTSLTANVGITGATVAGFDAAINLAAAANTIYSSAPADTYPAAGGANITTADTVDLVLALVGAVTTAPRFKIWAICVDMN